MLPSFLQSSPILMICVHRGCFSLPAFGQESIGSSFYRSGFGVKSIPVAENDCLGRAYHGTGRFSSAQFTFVGGFPVPVETHGTERTSLDTSSAVDATSRIDHDALRRPNGTGNGLGRTNVQARRVCTLFAGRREVGWQGVGAFSQGQHADPGPAGIQFTVIGQSAREFATSAPAAFFRIDLELFGHGCDSLCDDR
jgi:hypothetical protein